MPRPPDEDLRAVPGRALASGAVVQAISEERRKGSIKRQARRQAENSAPVRGRPFKKGESGNPGGRPAGYAAMQALARSHTKEAFDAVLAGLRDRRQRLFAAEIILERGWGKPAQPQTGEGGKGPVEHVIRWLTEQEAQAMSSTPPESPSPPNGQSSST
jgi:hypothetical protein